MLQQNSACDKFVLRLVHPYCTFWYSQGLLKDLSKNPSQPIQNPLPVPKGGVSCAFTTMNWLEVHISLFLFFSQDGTAITVGEQQQPLAITSNGHDVPS